MFLKSAGVWVQSLLAISVAVSPLAAQVRTPDAMNAELRRITAVKAYIDGVMGEPSSPGRRRRIGGVESVQIQFASLRWMRDLLPGLRSPQPEFVNYLADRMVAERDLPDSPVWLDGARFLREFSAAAQSAPVTFPAELAASVESARQAERQMVSLRVSDTPAEEARRQAALTNLVGKRRAVTDAIRTGLAGAGVLDAGTNPRWRALTTFLIADLDSAIRTSSGVVRDDVSLLNSMRDAFWRSSPRAADIEAAYVKVGALKETLSASEAGLLYAAFRPGQTPSSFLRNDLRQYLAAQEAYDREIERAAEILQSHGNRGLVVMFNAVIPIQDPLERRLAHVQGNDDANALSVLIDMADAYRAARVFDRDQVGDGYLRSSRFDRTNADSAVAAAGRLLTNWQRGGTDSLYALVPVDAEGQRVWSLGSWLGWEWLDMDSRDDLRNDGRVVTLDGRDWVIPPGSQRTAAAIAELRVKGQLKELLITLERSR